MNCRFCHHQVIDPTVSTWWWFKFTQKVLKHSRHNLLEQNNLCVDCLYKLRFEARMNWIVQVLNNEDYYRNDAETKGEKIFRLSRSLVRFLVPFGFPPYVKWVLEYGPLVSYPRDLIQSISLVVKLITSMSGVEKFSGNFALLGIYYLMAENREKNNMMENKFNFLATTTNINLDEISFYCSLAVNIGYESTAVDIQRLFAQQKYCLLLHESFYGKVFRNFGFPFSLAYNQDELVMVLPGTKNLGDVTTDMNAFITCSDSERGGGRFHSGIEICAKNIFLEIYPIIE